ncbi:hypothetical protein [Crossiella sp. NPDC003009]
MAKAIAPAPVCLRGEHRDHRADRMPDQHDVTQVEPGADVQNVFDVPGESGATSRQPRREF